MAVRLLVVDDDTLLLSGIIRVLAQFEISTAASTHVALRMLALQPFDAILTDLRVPTTNGIVLLQEVAAAYPRIERYLMSGTGYERLAEHLASGLVHRVFQKPLDVYGLRDALGQLALPPSHPPEGGGQT